MASTWADLVWDFGSREPAPWYLRAARLWRAAEIVRTAIAAEQQEIENGLSILAATNQELEGPATLLIGLALENALKGKVIEVVSHDESQDPAKLREWPGGGHQLTRLAEMAVFPFTDSGRDIAVRLEAHILWAGRYPVPKRRAHVTITQLGFTAPHFPMPIRGNEVETVRGWIEHLTGFDLGGASDKLG